MNLTIIFIAIVVVAIVVVATIIVIYKKKWIFQRWQIAGSKRHADTNAGFVRV